MKVNIQATHDGKISLDLDESMNMLHVKSLISAHLKDSKDEDVPTSAIRLIFAGKILKDADTVGESGVKEGHTLHMVKSMKKVETVPKAINVPASTPAAPSAAGPVSGSAPLSANPLFGLDPSMMPDLNNPAMQQASAQILQNPAVRQQMMDVMTANPELLRAAMQMNPMFAQMPAHVQEMMMNPDVIRTMIDASSEHLQANPTNTNMANLMSNNMGMFSSQPAVPVSSEPAEIRFADQIIQLQEMGFYDKSENIRVLTMTNGNVNAAIEILLASSYS